jgi:hypothetical protein
MSHKPAVYVIFSSLETKLNESQEPQFWSKDSGWGSLKLADRIRGGHINPRILPYTGRFITYKEAKSLLDNWKSAHTITAQQQQ